MNQSLFFSDLPWTHAQEWLILLTGILDGNIRLGSKDLFRKQLGGALTAYYRWAQTLLPRTVMFLFSLYLHLLLFQNETHHVNRFSPTSGGRGPMAVLFATLLSASSNSCLKSVAGQHRGFYLFEKVMDEIFPLSQYDGTPVFIMDGGMNESLGCNYTIIILLGCTRSWQTWSSVRTVRSRLETHNTVPFTGFYKKPGKSQNVQASLGSLYGGAEWAKEASCHTVQG